MTSREQELMAANRYSDWKEWMRLFLLKNRHFVLENIVNIKRYWCSGARLTAARRRGIRRLCTTRIIWCTHSAVPENMNPWNKIRNYQIPQLHTMDNDDSLQPKTQRLARITKFNTLAHNFVEYIYETPITNLFKLSCRFICIRGIKLVICPLSALALLTKCAEILLCALLRVTEGRNIFVLLVYVYIRFSKYDLLLITFAGFVCVLFLRVFSLETCRQKWAFKYIVNFPMCLFLQDKYAAKI